VPSKQSHILPPRLSADSSSATPSKINVPPSKEKMAPSAISPGPIPEEHQSIPIAEVAPLTTNGQKATEIRKMRIPVLGIDFTQAGKSRRAPTLLLNSGTIAGPLHGVDDSSATNLIQGNECCGGGCCRLPSYPTPDRSPSLSGIDVPDNEAFRSLGLKLSPLSSCSQLSGITPLPPKTISLESTGSGARHESTVFIHPPSFVTPHAPYEVFPAKIESARELTKPDAVKRTFHFGLDVTDYPEEAEGVDFRVGGAIGVQAPNNFDTVDAILSLLGVGVEERDAPVFLKTQGGRWPTIWGEEIARTLCTSRRELLIWTVDIQSYPPTKKLFRLLAEYAQDKDQKTILLYLCSKQGQAAFCEYVICPFLSSFCISD
jgi:hypothetical protein